MQTGTTARVSTASDGTQANGDSKAPSISADGRYVAFQSDASNLVTGDTNSQEDIFVHDLQTGTTVRVSTASDGTQANGDSQAPSISADGRYTAFQSDASNLVSGDTNGQWDIFVHDRQTGTTARVSTASDGTEANSRSWWPSISADGRYVAFGSHARNLVSGDTNGRWDIFVHDMQAGTTARVSIASDGTQAKQDSYTPSISVDGRYVAFQSQARNLVSGDTNGAWDIFVHDLQTGTTARVSTASDGTEANGHSQGASISADGCYVAFTSGAANLANGDANEKNDIFIRNYMDAVFFSTPMEDTRQRFTGWWYNNSRPGTGMALQIQAKKLFLAWFVYDQSGAATWYTSGGSLSNDTTYVGELRKWTGWTWGKEQYSFPTSTPAGTITLIFYKGCHNTIEFTANTEGLIISDTLGDFMKDFSPGMKDPRDLTGWWYDPEYNGMGFYLDARGGKMAMVWYNYRDNHTARWWTSTNTFPDGTSVYMGSIDGWEGGQCPGCAFTSPSTKPGEGGSIIINFMNTDRATASVGDVILNLERFQIP